MPIRDALHRRRFAGLTALCLGLLGVFGSLTLGAQGHVGRALALAGAGIVVAVLGLRWLPPRTG